MTNTLSSDGDLHPAARAAQAGEFLFYVLAAHRAPGDSTRHSLTGIDEVLITRDEVRGHRRDGRRLTLGFDDRWMSVSHARLRRHDQRWRLDCGRAKNLGYHNGQRVTEAWLCDGDVVELGRSFFVFRAAQPAVPGAPPDVSAAALRSTSPGLRTLSPRLAILFDSLPDLASSGLPFVITGETGTGKEVLARAVHELERRRGTFVALNCGGLPGDLAESELFGFRKGTFTGAIQDRPGLVRAAHGGTLFLDEVAELPLSVQAALLRVLQEREVLTLGSTQPVAVDFQLIVASHCDLDAAVASGRFRQDLRARLHGFTVRLPALRQRREDLGLLLAAIGASIDAGAPPLLGRLAARELFTRSWPRNIRELERGLRVAATLARGGVIEPHHLDGELSPQPTTPPKPPAPVTQLSASDAARCDHLASLLHDHRGNVTHVARALGKRPVQIYRWLKRYGLDPTTYR
jgi:DNA-binding NtrC family response regulator